MSQRVVQRASAGWLVVFALLVAGCGDDGATPPGVGTGDDRDADAGHDAGLDAGYDAALPPDPPAAGSTGESGSGGSEAPPVEEDASVPSCDDLDCERMNDECAVYVCDDAEPACMAQPMPDGTPCGSDERTNCTAPDRCEAGACVPNDAPAGTACGDQGRACHVDDECDGEGNCTDNGLLDEGAVCGDQDDDACTDPDTCDALGACQPRHAAEDTPCGDIGVLCKLDDRCDGAGACIDSGNADRNNCGSLQMTLNGDCICGSTDTSRCHPVADTCAAGVCVSGNLPNGTVCDLPGAVDTECNLVDRCDDGICKLNLVAPNTPCGSAANNPPCNGRDTCDGAGSCDPRLGDPNTICGAAPGECFAEPRCTGSGTCGTAGFAAVGSMCGDQTESECDHADTCSGGTCHDNLVTPGTLCGDMTQRECSAPDTCNAAGQCAPNHASPGAQCGDQNATCLNDDACNANGSCVDNGVTSPCAMRGELFAGGAPAVGVVVAVIGGDSTITDANGEFDLQVPVSQDFLMRLGAMPGYYGSVRARRYEPAQLENTLVFSLLSDANAEMHANAIVPAVPVDRGRGVVQFNFMGNAAGGGEQLALSTSSETPVHFTPPSTYTFSATNTSPEAGVFWYNVTATSTAVTVTDGPSNDCRLAYTPPGGTYPVFAHTTTRVFIACD